MKKHIYFFLDKDWVPAHSFVDGFICNPKFINVYTPTLVVSRIKDIKKKENYKGVDCLCYLSSRRGLGRIIRFFEAISIVLRTPVEGRETVFVRNDPLILLALFFMKKLGFIKKIIYQNSFPHETHSNFLGLLAKIIFKLSFPSIDVIYIVADDARQRLLKYYKDCKFRVVPLLLQDDMIKDNIIKVKSGSKVNFIYVGTLAKIRKIEFFIQAFSRAYQINNNFTLKIVGGEENEIDMLMRDSLINQMVKLGGLSFQGKVSRSEISNYILEAHIGISIIPPIDMYKESSPTKLGEYLGHGLPVLVTSGIPFQDKIAEKTDACYLINYDQEEIISTIIKLTQSPKKLTFMSHCAVEFARENLAYSNIVDASLEDFL